ncbi:VWA domain-containing protein [Derxia lacustris]|uniref:VWA domain-containing protein n=1 Tax=Derxia lacustris TaxID=764842 RepID=UPI00111C3DD1|nr:VWA domain-containing protein [Derxia lacustris]
MRGGDSSAGPGRDGMGGPRGAGPAGPGNRSRRRLRLLGAALLLLAGAVWNPAITVERPVTDVVVVLDISQSMDVPDQRLDGRPVSRLAFAKAALREALGALPCGSRLGLAIFSEYRILLLTAPAEVCGAHAELVALLGRLDNQIAWTNASEIRKGVLNAREAALALPERPALVFITDGQEAPPLGPGQGRHFDGKPGELRGLLLGVGGDLPQPIPKTDKLGHALGLWSEAEVVQGAAGGQHLSALDEPHLIQLAAEIGFDYRRLDRPEALAGLLGAANLRQPASGPLALGDGFALAALALIALAFSGGWRRSARR